MAEQIFSGQTALITGSSRGIGRATALLLARRGADVAVQADLRDQAAVAAAVQAVGAAFGRIDMPIANAASTAFKLRS